MSHGLPDYYRGVDIAYQALAEMIIRPKYGVAELASGVQAVAPNDETVFCTISGKGMTYGGYILMDHTATQAGSRPRIYLDGSLLFNSQFATMDKYVWDKIRGTPFFLTKYDNVNFVYCVLVGYGLTFEASIKLAYYEGEGSNPTVSYGLYYALV